MDWSESLNRRFSSVSSCKMTVNVTAYPSRFFKALDHNLTHPFSSSYSLPHRSESGLKSAT